MRGPKKNKETVSEVKKDLSKTSKKNLLEIVLLQSKTNDSLAKLVNKNKKRSKKNSKNKKLVTPISPTTVEAEKALKKENYKLRYKKILKSTICTLIVVIALSVITASLLLPVLQVCGNSMEPTLENDDVLLSVKQEKFKRGDIVAFYYNNKVLVKRIIASAGDYVEIDRHGNVFVNSNLVEEPYTLEKSLGECNQSFPYQVPDNSYFVLGDARENSNDSRNTTIGAVSGENIIGKILFRIWPLNNVGKIN